ncbi:MAG: patatin-like phospholipase family protein [Pseudomonadota bacterium]
MNNTPSNKSIALALQGGGSHGAFTWGVLDALLEDGRIDIEGVSGTSAGGMNGAALMQGLVKGGKTQARKELKHFWEGMHDTAALNPFHSSLFTGLTGTHNLGHSPFYQAMTLVRHTFSPYEFNPLNMNILKDFIDEFFDFSMLRDMRKVKLFLCATHLETGKLKIFKGRDLSKKALLASACLPFIFQAIEIKGQHYWDGGYIGNPAMFPLAYNCATRDILVVQLTRGRRNKLPKTAEEIYNRHREITYNSSLVREMRVLNFISKLVDRGSVTDKSIKSMHIHVIRNREVFRDLDLSSAMNTDWGFLLHLFETGRATAKDWLQSHFDDVGVRTTANLEEDFIE